MKAFIKMSNEVIALLSIKPEFAEQIISGKKKYEFRRIKFKQPVNYILIYASSPVKAFIGMAKVDRVLEISPKELWLTSHLEAGISEERFFQYFNDCDMGVGIKLSKVFKFRTPLLPQTVFEKFIPPQSFKYLQKGQLESVLKRVEDNEDSFRRWCSRSR